MCRDDIEGAKSEYKRVTSKPRDLNLKVDDIEGARPHYPHLDKTKKNHNTLDYRDVTSKKTHTRRFSTNPLTPDYHNKHQDPITSAI